MTFSIYGTVSSYNDKKIIEKDKNEIISYKYLLTKTIQDDFVNNELSHINIENPVFKNWYNKPSKINIKYHLWDAINNCTSETKTYTVGK